VDAFCTRATAALTPRRFATTTQDTQTTDWIVRRRKFMLNWDPETTYSESTSTSQLGGGAFRIVCVAGLTVDNLAGKNGKREGWWPSKSVRVRRLHSVNEAGRVIQVSPSSGCWMRSSRAPAVQGG
jgi:hypothetical protein